MSNIEPLCIGDNCEVLLNFSLAGFPSMTIPSGLDDQGLPLAVQMSAGPHEEEKLLAIAAWVQGLLSFDHRPY